MTWNHDISTAPRDGSHFLMATTDGKRYLTRWLMPTKFTPNGRFDGFSENAKTLLAWCAVPEHPFAAASQGEAAVHSDVSVNPLSRSGSDGANAGGGHVTDGETAQPDSAGGHVVGSPDALIVHKHIFIDDAGSGR